MNDRGLDGDVVAEVFTNERGTKMVRRPCQTCGEPFEIVASHAGRGPNCAACKTPTLGSTPSGYGYVARDFAPYLEEIIANADRRLRAAKRLDDDEGSGAMDEIANDVALTLNMTPEAAIRRIYGYRTIERRMVCAEFADALFLAAGRTITRDPDFDLRVYPTTLVAARDMVECAAEDAGEALTDAEIDARARALCAEALADAYAEELREAA